MEDEIDEARSRPAREVVSYMRTLDGQAHPALNTINGGVVYDNERDVYVIEAPLELLNFEVEQEAKLFNEAAASYEEEAHKKYKTGHDITQQYSIKDVVEQIDTALIAYKREGERTVWQMLRKGFWKLGERSNALEKWLKLLPESNDYCSAAARIGDVRNAAFDALTEIPTYLENTRDVVGIFSNSESLRKCGVKLYSVTLGALRHILTWFKKRAIGKAFEAFLKQSSYQKHLTEKIKDIETVSMRFKDISLVCLQREVVSTSKTVNSIAALSVNNHVILKETIDRTNRQLALKAEKTNEALAELMLNDTKGHEATQQALSDELQTLKEQYGNQLEISQKTAESLNTVQTLLESIYAALPLYDTPKISTIEPPPYTNLIQSSVVLEALQSEKDVSERDLANCLRSIGVMNRAEEDRAVWVMKSTQLRHWMISTTSSALLIHGNSVSTSARSPITFVCARLIDTLKATQSRSLIVMHYFCGEHTSLATDENATPFALMNSLLAQLLIQNPDFSVSSEDLASVSKNTLDGLTRLFVKLVAQLSRDTMVFCVVDGISLYEDAARLDETRKVASMLVSLLGNGDRGGPVVKVLMSSATRIRHPPEGLGSDSSLIVPRHVPAQSRFRASKWGEQMRSDLDQD